mmetsp:Transcript_39053/g.94432  ORF Transcript_39053/g.94432 Transcript_39053/m.94432 type:complete len:135 (-) Transcript_39053:132-536(-)|eukprot:CAMPEP_0113601082 /NCGR_PEP_ID=MMETSP0017_2-20120614/44_1 /TAXON_ID=2856 /ORGANISM="Cylindrotheca closterium" /LENGTH=134 /DNA_ID=CAMNT_0000509361 /DNA_START=425 /DNA_END=829 /DNA_ORIENTATION=+ /assembly_acc=CAM_ASM_000147
MVNRSALQQSDSIRSMQSSVSFTTIEVHEHPMILSDGPSVSGGPAVQIDWTQQSESTMSLDDYEASKMMERRKSLPQMMIPGSFRTAILVESGYTMNEIKETAARTPPPKRSLRRSISMKVKRLFKSRSSTSLS